LRGQTGVLHQLQICIGILVGQALGLRQVLGGPEYWSYLLAVPLVPSLIGGLALLFFFPETPKALLIKQKSLEKARSALQKLRSDKNVHSDIQEIYDESKASDGSGSGNGGGGGLLGVGELFTSKELRWPLITSLVIMSVQQLCGVNAIFFYSASIFKSAGIPDEFIQYAILSTGLVNVVMTFCSILLVDKLGRKPLLTFPMLLMILNFVALTACLALQSPERPLLSYATVALVILFIVCFAIGLGPIPFVYVTECFRQNARSSAISVAVTVNYISAIVLTLGFPFLQAALGEYVFLVFLVTVSLGLAVVWSKVPETKGKSIEEIIASFQ
jgi:sugar porter (SP) family MFS transporter